MKKFIYLLFLCFFISNAQYNSQFSTGLDNCLSEQDLLELQNAVSYFDNQLEERYKTNTLNEAYLAHLESFYAKEYDESSFNFFMDKNAISIIEKLKNSKTFDKIWISLSTAVSEIRDEKGDPILNDPDNEKLVIVNKYGDYQKCIKASSNNRAIRNYLEFEMENPGMSFILSARYLRRELNVKDFDDDLNKLVIAIGFFYEHAYMMHNYYSE